MSANELQRRERSGPAHRANRTSTSPAYLRRTYTIDRVDEPIVAFCNAARKLILECKEPGALYARLCECAVKIGRFSLAQFHITTAFPGCDPNPTTASFSSGDTGIVRPCFTIAQIDVFFSSHGTNNAPVVLPRSALEAYFDGKELPVCQTVIIVPLCTHTCIAGILVLALQTDFISSNDLRLLQTVGSNLAFALEYQDSKTRLSYLLDFDSVTGLVNRPQFLRRLGRTIRATCGDGTQLIVGVLEIAHINTVSHIYGSDLVDKLVRHVAHRLTQVALLQGSVARLSLDCFAFSVKTRFDSTTTSEIIFQRLVQALDRPFSVAGNEVCVSPRLGLAFLKEGHACAEQLVADAASAAREAQEQKLNVVCFDPDIRAKAASRLVLETKVRKAWEARQFELHYQPQVDLKTGAISGIEALIRWRQPSGMQIGPEEFVCVLEDTGLIVDVGMWVLETALRQCVAWKAMALPVPRLSVNFSHVQVDQEEFVSEFLSRLEAVRGVELECEITESVFSGNIEASIEKLKVLRKAGIKIAIDDFGTGYSSLGAVSRLPIDTVKIDRSFLTCSGADESKRSIVDTIVSLAKALSLRVIAEGVESIEQESMLKQIGCDEAQGFYYSRPVSPVQIECLLAERL